MSQRNKQEIMREKDSDCEQEINEETEKQRTETEIITVLPTAYICR